MIFADKQVKVKSRVKFLFANNLFFVEESTFFLELFYFLNSDRK